MENQNQNSSACAETFEIMKDYLKLRQSSETPPTLSDEEALRVEIKSMKPEMRNLRISQKRFENDVKIIRHKIAKLEKIREAKIEKLVEKVNKLKEKTQEKIAGRWRGIEHPDYFINVKFIGLMCLVKRTNDLRYTLFTVGGNRCRVEYVDDVVMNRIVLNGVEEWRIEMSVEGDRMLYRIVRPAAEDIKGFFERVGEPELA